MGDWADAMRLEDEREEVEREVADLLAREGIPHDHREYVEGCFRCDLSKTESTTEEAR